MLGRRLLVLVAVLLGLAAVTTSLAPREGTRSSDDSAGETRPDPSKAELEPRDTGRRSNVTATDDVPTEPPLMELDALKTRQRVRVPAGQRVRLEVSSLELASVQIGDDGPVQAIDPDSPARFDLLYASPAKLAIRVRGAAGGKARTIGRLEVLPAL